MIRDRDRYRVQVVGKGRGGKTGLTGSQNLELSASAGFEAHHGTTQCAFFSFSL